MKLLRSAIACLVIPLALQAAPHEARTWTPAQVQPFSGELISTSTDSVTVKRLPDGQVYRLKLADCSAADRDYVAGVLRAAREAESFDATLSGELTWRLPPWNNLAWQNRQPAELWIWDDAARKPVEKVAKFDVEYHNSSKRNEFIGSYTTPTPVRLWKPAKYVIVGRFRGTVNGEEKSLEQTSTPFLLPSSGGDALKLNIIRFTLTR